MRFLLSALFFIVSFASRLEACSCAGSGSPCQAAGMATAAFTGTVIEVEFVPAQFPAEPTAPSGAQIPAGRARGPMRIKPAFRVIRIQIDDVLSGIPPWQREIEIVTGLGGGDCGYSFQPGVDYVVYASKDGEGRLQTSICSRTRPLAQAAEDVQYFQAKVGASLTGEIRVLTGFRGVPGRPGVSIVAAREGLRYRALTNAAGDAMFTDLPPGEYVIHEESDGDLPDDPKVQLNDKGCRDVTLFRTLRIVGRVMTRDGRPAARVEVQARSTSQAAVADSMTNPEGYYELRINKPGHYYIGINLNRSPTRETPYPRWFYPGTDDQSSAEITHFSGKPDTRTYDFTLPDRQKERLIEGVVFTAEGGPMPRARLMVYDFAENIVVSGTADSGGRFQLRVFANNSYRLHAVWPGEKPGTAVSAVPTDIQPDDGTLILELFLTQPGNSVLGAGRKGPEN